MFFRDCNLKATINSEATVKSTKQEGILNKQKP